jgi:hypothetical protein
MRLLAADRLAVGPQVLGVVEVDAGDDRAVGVDRVHRVQPAAHAHFQDHQVQRRLRQRAQDDQVVNSNQVSVMPPRAPPPPRSAAAARRRRSSRPDAAALLEVHQVRLAVQPDAVAGLRAMASSMAQVEPLPLVPATTITQRHVEVQAQAVAQRGAGRPASGRSPWVLLLAVGEPVVQRGRGGSARPLG